MITEYMGELSSLLSSSGKLLWKRLADKWDGSNERTAKTSAMQSSVYATVKIVELCPSPNVYVEVLTPSYLRPSLCLEMGSLKRRLC